MIFSHSCQYAIKSCIYLAVKQDKIDVTEISEFINSPVSFTSKILQKLAKSNIISSAKGRGGGFYLDNLQYQTTTIKDICEIFDNEGTLKGCVLGLSKCNKKILALYIIMLWKSEIKSNIFYPLKSVMSKM